MSLVAVFLLRGYDLQYDELASYRGSTSSKSLCLRQVLIMFCASDLTPMKNLLWRDCEFCELSALWMEVCHRNLSPNFIRSDKWLSMRFDFNLEQAGSPFFICSLQTIVFIMCIFLRSLKEKKKQRL